MRAALFFRHPVRPDRWRSRQLYETLIRPPGNHRASGFFHCSTFRHFLNQWSSEAIRAQNASGDFIDCLYNFWYWVNERMCAEEENFFAGPYFLFSRTTEVKCVEVRFMRSEEH